MAPKAASPKQDPPKSPKPHVVTIALETASVAFSLLSLSLVLFAYERALIPLYGSGPTTFLLNKIVLATVLVAAVHPFDVSLTRNWLYTALDLSAAPNTAYWVAVYTSRRKEPVLGPAITHVVTLAPLVFFLTTSILEANLKHKRKKWFRSPLGFRLASAGLTYIVATLLSQRLWARASFLNSISESQIFLTLAGVAWAQWTLRYPFPAEPQKKPKRSLSLTPMQTKGILLAAFAASWYFIARTLSSPVLPHPLKETYTHPSVPLQIHSSVQSTTGLIVVGEALPPPGYDGREDQEMHSVRYLRASHSILGGVWMGAKVHVLDDEPPVHDSFGTQLGDSIYATFVLQEAVRLVNSTQKGKAGLWENGLIIGLGTGISATAFSRHGISTTIVEIDPAVYDAARTYFGLPDPGPGKVFLEDARSWVANQRASIQAGNKEVLYDFVVHDCFSGGGVPEHIFTMEFWDDLKAVIQPDGVVVVNFAGIMKTESTKMVLLTLEKSFGQCRAFHDLFGDLTDDKYDTDFINIVLFCTSSKVPLTFRRPRRSDYLGSPLRRHVLDSFLSREINLDLIRNPANEEENSKYILTDAHNPLGKFQEEQGAHHWKLMRHVLPDVHWETY
ncbi:hypothetical protein Hypma_012759 [Hypsizygus marmoreus]|uniref:Polyamine aminopropyltransferase n=1 Tax=Hypsizygus marmoreus TaxID=39966 RepID=A0A369JDE4_HYPMA|nr:hypothetical protein Hypma_012759 [Hypsizygus marmoreus]